MLLIINGARELRVVIVLFGLVAGVLKICGVPHLLVWVAEAGDRNLR